MDTTVSARIDSKLKNEAESILSMLGLSHSTAINALYSQIALRQGLPFEVKLPNVKPPSSLTLHKIQQCVIKHAKEYGAERVYLFGSYARGTATEESDVDLRVDKGNITGFALGGFLSALQDELGRTVDISTTESLDQEFLRRIKKDEVLLYER